MKEGEWGIREGDRGMKKEKRDKITKEGGKGTEGREGGQRNRILEGLYLKQDL